MPDEMISLITYTPTTDPANAPSKSILGDAVSGTAPSSIPDGNKSIGRVEVSVKVIEAQMTQLMKSMGGVLGRAKQSAGEIAGMELQEIELSVEINAEGKVSLIGVGGAQAGASGAITLKFGKPDPQK